MNEKVSAPMAVTNGEIRENGEIKNSASGDSCGVGDSFKVCSKTHDNSKSSDSMSDFESNPKIHSGMLCDDPVLKVCDSVANPDNLPANMISKQVDPCEPDSKGSDSLVEDSADTLTENEVEDDFKLALSPEASVADNLSEQNQEDFTVQAVKSSSNISEDMEVDGHKEELKLSEETDNPDLGKQSPDIARLSDVNMGSDINNCAVGEGVVCGDSEMIIDKDCASGVCVSNTSNNESGSDVPSLLEERAKPLKEITEPSKVTVGSPSSVSARKETEDAGPSSNTENCQESSSSLTQDETEVAVQGSNTEGCQVSLTSSTTQDDVEGVVQSSNTEGCIEISNHLMSSDEKSTKSENDSRPILGNFKNNSEPVLDDIKNNAEPVLDDGENNAESVLSDVKTNAEPVLGDVENNAESVLNDVKINAKPVLDDVESNAEPVLDVKNNANPVLDDMKCSAESSLDNCKNVTEPVLDECKNDAELVLDEPVSDKVKRNLESVLDVSEKNAEPVLGDVNINAEPVLNDQCKNNLEMSSTEKERRKLEEASNVEIGSEEHRSDVESEKVSEEDSIMVEKVADGIVVRSDDVSENKSNDRVASPNIKTSDDKTDEEITSPNDNIMDKGNDRGTASLSVKMEDDSLSKRSTSTNQTNDTGRFTPVINDIKDGSAELSEAQKEDALLVSPIKNTSFSNESNACKSQIGVEEEDLLKSPKREKEDEQMVYMEDEAALLSSPDRRVTENKLLEEETQALEEDVLLTSPEPKIMDTDEVEVKFDLMNIEVKEDEWLNSPETKTTTELAEYTYDLERNDAALNNKEDSPVDDGAKATSPASQGTEPLMSEALNSDSSVNAAVSTEVVESVKAEEPMEVEEELKLERSGTSYCSDTSDVKSTVFSSSSRKDEKGSASMTLSRKRAHSPVADSGELDEKSKLARTVNGFDEGSSDEHGSLNKEEDVATEKKIYEMCFDMLDGSVTKGAKSDDTADKKDVPEVTLECEADMKSKEEVEESLLDPVDLSYLRKLHKGRVEKLSRNDLEELLVQKLCEAITERSEVGEMRLRCQALERGQEKWKEKYSQLQKQVRELNIVIKKFLSEQASVSKDKSTPPIPVRITRSVGLQVALPGSSQRTLAGMRMRAQREAAAASSAVTTATASPSTASSAVASSAAASSAAASSAAASSAVTSSAVTSSTASAANSNANKPASTNSPNVSPALNSGPVRTVTVNQSPARRLQETPTKITSPTIQQLSQRQISGNIRPRTNSNVAMRGHQQTHVVHQVQQRQQSIQASPHTSVPQVVMSPNSTPTRVQVVLAPQQQQQLLQQQQIVLRQPQPANKDVEIIDLDKDDRSRQTTRNTVQHISQVPAAPSFPPNGNMTVRLVSNQQSGTPLTSQSHMTLLVPATAQQQKMIITSAPSTVQLNSNQGKSRTNSGVVLKGVVQAMQTQGNSVRQQGVVQQGTIIPSRGLTIVQPPQQAQQPQQQMPQLQQLRPIRVGHPAPLPAAPLQPDNPIWKMPPPKPSLKIQHTDNGIVLSWNMNLYSSHEDIDTYQLYAYQEGSSPPSSSLWKKVGDVKALPLPMACTLTQKDIGITSLFGPWMFVPESAPSVLQATSA